MEDPVHLILVMVILPQIILPAMAKSAALLPIVAIVLGMLARNVQLAVALKVMGVGVVILLPVRVVLAPVPVLRVVGHSVRAMRIVQVVLVT